MSNAALRIFGLLVLALTLEVSAAIKRVAATTQSQKSYTVQIIQIDAKPTVINASLNDAGVKQIFDEIGRQAHVTIRPNPPDLFASQPVADLRLSAVFDHEPYFDALREACEQSDLIAVPQDSSEAANEQMISRKEAGRTPAPSCTGGPVEFRVVTIARKGKILFADPEHASRSLEVDLSAIVEPKILGPVVVKSVRVDRAVDEHGRSVATSQPAEALVGAWSASRVARVPVALDFSASSKLLKDLSGEVELEIPREVASIVIKPMTEESVDVPVGRNHLIVDRPGRAAADVLEMRLKRGDAVGDEDWAQTQRMIVAAGPVQATAADGKPILLSGWGSNGGRETVEMNYHFRPAGGQVLRDATLSRQLPVSEQTIRAKFEFHDLALPK